MTRVLRFADAAVRVEARGPRASALVEFAFARVCGENDAEPHASFVLREDEDTFVVEQDGTESSFEAPGDALERLVGECTRELIERTGGGLVLHAAALLGVGGITLLGGASGAGKTTLSARLITRGMAYLSEELAWAPTDDTLAYGLTRPLSIKGGALDVVAPLVRDARPELAVPWSHGALYDARAFGTFAEVACAPVARVIFPRFERGAPFRLERLSEGRGAQEILGMTANARNLPRHGLGDAAHLARAVPVYELTYGAFDDLGPLDRLLDGDEETSR